MERAHFSQPYNIIRDYFAAPSTMAPASRKRYIDTVDLTGVDELRESNEQPRKISRSGAVGWQSSSVNTGASTPSQSQVIQVDENDESYAEELADGSQAAEDAYTSSELYGEQIQAMIYFNS